MPWHSFQYTEFSLDPSPLFPSGKIRRRPFLQVSLIAPNGRTFQCVACADTGADLCVFPMSFGLSLGLNVLAMKKELTAGMGNSGNITYFEEIELDCGHGIRFKTTVGFTPGLESQGFGLLGQDGFFETYNTIFSHKQNVFAIEVP